ncbi:VOC family protein [Caldibacillus thermoamylovorans]|nr:MULTISPECIES: VOC family protein [Bacillaceae]MCB5935602.1 VOC family protein [Bacillus sp. DFI.2.34]MBU5343798.1 VOC family protein [Caldifermentibacillus hisashii]MCB7071677.1 VOC family protein [Caldibacillus sp. 210928-DFI.2.22]MCB7077753.1 VOC family protein [Caldibacillus thermoamylovorans]MED3642782.1 VOC family protein [Caldifermentibacillus hisashii]
MAKKRNISIFVEIYVYAEFIYIYVKNGRELRMSSIKRVNHQPKGMKTVNPYLMVDNVAQLIDFIETVFDGKLKYKLDRPNGTIMHAEMIIGDSIIMAGEPMEKYGSMPASIYMYVPDCDTVYEKALQHGAEPIMPPTDMKHAGERYGGVKDGSGNIWWIATHIEDLTPQEQAKRIQEMEKNWE